MSAALSILSDQKKLINMILIIVVVVVLFIIIRRIVKQTRDRARSRSLVNSADKEIVQNQKTMTESQYAALADTIFRAMTGCSPGYNSEALISALSTLKTTSDWNSLVKAFGIRKSTCSYLSRFEGNLIEWLQDELYSRWGSARDRSIVNSILGKFGVRI